MEKLGMVSLWVGTAPDVDQLETYLLGDGNGDLEDPSAFEDDFQPGFWDDDFREAEVFPNPVLTLDELLRGCSYERRVIPKFANLYGPELPPGTNATILLYNFEYSGQIVEASRGSIAFRYIGCVPYK